MVRGINYAEIVEGQKGYLVGNSSGNIGHRDVESGVPLGKVINRGVELYYDVEKPNEVDLILELRKNLDRKSVPIRDIPTLEDLYMNFNERQRAIGRNLKRLENIFSDNAWSTKNEEYRKEFANAPVDSR